MTVAEYGNDEFFYYVFLPYYYFGYTFSYFGGLGLECVCGFYICSVMHFYVIAFIVGGWWWPAILGLVITKRESSIILCKQTKLCKVDITIKEAQQRIDDWIQTVGVRYFGELTNLGILMEEVGELSRLMVRTYGEQSFKESDKGKDLGDEMADVLWVLMCLANQTSVDLTAALERNFEKKNVRDANRHRDNEKLR